MKPDEIMMMVMVLAMIGGLGLVAYEVTKPPPPPPPPPQSSGGGNPLGDVISGALSLFGF